MNVRLEFQHKLQALEGDVIRLGSMVDEAIANAIKALEDGDLVLAQQVVRNDENINRLRYYIEEHGSALIATQQPLARDLRTIIAAMYVATNLERMADHAAGVARLTLRMAKIPRTELIPQFRQMADVGREMLNQSLEAFIHHDAELAHKVAARDDEIDELYNIVFQEMIHRMIENPEQVQSATFLLWVAHNLERIGDRVTNICERVIYMVTGELMEFVDDRSDRDIAAIK